MNHFLQAAASLIGPAHLLTKPADIGPYALDWRQRYKGRPLAVALPGSSSEVSALVRLCRHHQVAIVPQGGNTSTCGAATPDSSGRQLVIAMRRLNAVRNVDANNNAITVEAGATLEEVQLAAREATRLFPMSIASEGSCQIGGNLSTNAGGVAVLTYGTMRELTLGLEVVLPDGQLLNALTALRKDNTGLDIKQLFIGAEGQLGLITAATLRIFPLPSARVTALIGVDNIETAITWLNSLRQRFHSRITTFEVIEAECQRMIEHHRPGRLPFTAPWLLLIELSDAGEDAVLHEALIDWMSAQAVHNGVVATSELARRKLWLLREEISEIQRQDGPSIKHDIAVPTSVLARLIRDCGAELRQAYPGVRIATFGHAGDGNLHYNISHTHPGNVDLFEDEKAVNTIVYNHVYRLGGTLAAEHGIGQLKSQWLEDYKDPVALSLMRKVKSMLDPERLMNPGKWL